ncbi:hypothetical protein [Enterovibrio norvegicus]|uniref:hypothetical protein n=1 Tax=Enterovibrio norvegicus TaxID=188144 RepID=UPI00352C28C2
MWAIVTLCCGLAAAFLGVYQLGWIELQASNGFEVFAAFIAYSMFCSIGISFFLPLIFAVNEELKLRRSVVSKAMG